MKFCSIRLRISVYNCSVRQCALRQVSRVRRDLVKSRLKTGITLAAMALALLTSFSANAEENRLIDRHVTQLNLNQTICDARYLDKVTPSFDSQAQRKEQLLKERGIDSRNATVYAFEFRVPILLGGIPDLVDNVDLRRWDGAAGARRKRRLTVVLRHCVCAGKVPLHRAQVTISGDWSARFAHLWSLSCRDF
ncbi:hypothetical protein PAMC26510_38145 [Caballeronia sordidicola]|uniref:Uncharacterized protein n=1 Tax=Caballeronia sordidicola TaxID=196367 RepID=A0A242M2G6_CABSO|nr:hypothetical protein PAMC26510_38145 [Caballeronia sordidicola]